jgi:hypothetical protein
MKNLAMTRNMIINLLQVLMNLIFTFTTNNITLRIIFGSIMVCGIFLIIGVSMLYRKESNIKPSDDSVLARTICNVKHERIHIFTGFFNIAISILTLIGIIIFTFNKSLLQYMN